MLSAFCAAPSLSCHFSQELSSLHHGVLPAVPSAHKFLGHISASLLPWQGLILLPPQRAAHREVRQKRSLGFDYLLFPFPFFPHLLPCPSFSTSTWNLQPCPAETGQGLCSAIPASRLLQDTAERRFEVGLRLNTPEEMAGEAALLPLSLALPGYTQLLQEKAYCFPLFFLDLYLHAYDRFTVILSVYD